MAYNWASLFSDRPKNLGFTDRHGFHSTSQALMPHRSDGLVGYHSYSLAEAKTGRMGLSVHRKKSTCCWNIQSTPIWKHHMVLYMVLSWFIMFHLFFSFWWSNTLLIGTIQMSGHQIRSNLTVFLGEIWWNLLKPRPSYRTHPGVLFVSTRNPVALDKTFVWLFKGDEGKRNVNALDLLKVVVWGGKAGWMGRCPQSSSIDRWWYPLVN